MKLSKKIYKSVTLAIEDYSKCRNMTSKEKKALVSRLVDELLHDEMIGYYYAYQIYLIALEKIGDLYFIDLEFVHNKVLSFYLPSFDLEITNVINDLKKIDIC